MFSMSPTRDHSFSMYEKFTENLKLTSLTRTCAYQGVRMFGMLGNFFIEKHNFLNCTGQEELIQKHLAIEKSPYLSIHFKLMLYFYKGSPIRNIDLKWINVINGVYVNRITTGK